MKVNEVVNEALWDKVKTVGKSVSSGLGNAAMGSLRFLDKLSGGTGKIGTAKQQAAYAAKTKKQELASARSKLPADALQKFELEMSEKGFNINNPSTFNSNQMAKEMQEFASRYFAGGEQPAIKKYINQSIPYQPTPSVLNKKTIQNYFSEINKIRANGYLWAQQQTGPKIGATVTPQTQTTSAPKQPGLTQGVQVISSARPLVLRFKNKDYALTDDDRWVYLGSDKSPKPEMVQFLNKQLERL